MRVRRKPSAFEEGESQADSADGRRNCKQQQGALCKTKGIRTDMSATEKLRVPTSNRSILKIVVVVLLIMVLFFMLPLYLQNRLNSLYETQHKLSQEVTFLQRDALLLELKINQLSSLENLGEFAEGAELDLNGVPVKVLMQGGRNE
jgi:cell division protein FtsL